MPTEVAGIHRYQCRVCGEIYGNENKREAYMRALACEKKPVEEKICEIDDRVEVKYIRGLVEIVNIQIEEESHKIKYYYRYEGKTISYLYKENIMRNKGPIIDVRDLHRKYGEQK